MKRRATHGGHLPGDTNCGVTVTIVKAAKLAAKHGGSKMTSDPYCMVRVGNIEQRTKTMRKNLNPTWNETFEFEKISEQHALIRIALYDAEALRSAGDNFLGEVIVPVCSLAAEDEEPTWREVEVRPGSTEFVSGELCIRVCKVGGVNPSSSVSSKQPIKPSPKRARQSVIERESFGSTPFSRMFVIAPSEISFADGKPLGQGGFGTVRLGHFRGLAVAVKTLTMRDDVDTAELTDEFKREVAMLAKVSHHPKLCLFLGASLVEPLTLVSELMSGSVRGLLDKPRKDSTALLPWDRRVEILLDAALGMAFLHGMAVVHRDMKADNLLVDPHGNTKVADFGLSKTLQVLEGSKTRGDARLLGDVGTPGFKAPEVYGDERKAATGYSLPVDVFAFGATIYELLSFKGKNWGWPFGWALDLASDDAVEEAVRAGKLPTALGGSPVPADCPPKLKKLYEECMALDPKTRPAFADIVARLRELLKEARG